MTHRGPLAAGGVRPALQRLAAGACEMRTTPYNAKLEDEPVLVQLGSDGLYIVFPEGAGELPPAELRLPFQRLTSWMDSGQRLHCNDASLGEVVLDMQEAQHAASVARMMMTLAVRLRDAETASAGLAGMRP